MPVFFLELKMPIKGCSIDFFPIHFHPVGHLEHGCFSDRRLARMFDELLSRDHEDGRATWSTIAECGLKICRKAREKQETYGKISTIEFHIINGSQKSEI